jgi:hypothetical protein
MRILINLIDFFEYYEGVDSKSIYNSIYIRSTNLEGGISYVIYFYYNKFLFDNKDINYYHSYHQYFIKKP